MNDQQNAAGRVTETRLLVGEPASGEPAPAAPCAEKVELLRRPFQVYEDYKGLLHIIDADGRIVLSDVFAYDKDREAKNARMDAMAAALSAVSAKKRSESSE